MSTAQPRRPAGTPAGGQYEPRARDEASTALQGGAAAVAAELASRTGWPLVVDGRWEPAGVLTPDDRVLDPTGLHDLATWAPEPDPTGSVDVDALLDLVEEADK